MSSTAAGTTFTLSGVSNRAKTVLSEVEEEWARGNPDHPIEQNKIDINEELKICLGAEAKIEAAGMVETYPGRHVPVKALAIYSQQKMHGFVKTVWEAFSYHLPISLSPDHIWLLVLQGVAKHVEANSDRLRHRFVPHDGKKILQVRRDDFVKGSRENDWPAFLQEIGAQMETHLKEDVHALFTKPFSTSTLMDATVAEITLMDAMKDYFDYVCLTRCGIPEITLEGTTTDWEDLRSRVAKLSGYDDQEIYQKWLDAVDDKLEQFCQSSKGEIDESFWKSFFKINNSSGGPYVTGWINTFLPYLIGHDSKLRWNQGAIKPADDENHFSGAGVARLPSGLSCAPFDWQYYESTYKMKLAGGFLGLSQDIETLALRPCVGWAVMESK